jgi:hypothetical protein
MGVNRKGVTKGAKGMHPQVRRAIKDTPIHSKRIEVDADEDDGTEVPVRLDKPEGRKDPPQKA